MLGRCVGRELQVYFSGIYYVDRYAPLIEEEPLAGCSLVPPLDTKHAKPRKTREKRHNGGRGAAGRSAHLPPHPQLPLRARASQRFACRCHNICCHQPQRAMTSSGAPSPKVGLIIRELFRACCREVGPELVVLGTVQAPRTNGSASIIGLVGITPG